MDKQNQTKQDSQVNMEGEQNWRTDTHNFKTYYKATVIKACDIGEK